MPSQLHSDSLHTVVVFSCATPQHALGYLRLWGPLTGLGLQVNWFLPGDKFVPEQIDSADLVIIQRDFPRFTAQFAQVLQAAAAAHKPVIFDLDDLLWELPADHPDRRSHFYTSALWPMLLAALCADAVTVASAGLLEYLQPLNPAVYLLPNMLDTRLWELREVRTQETGITWIGYIGGGSHRPDLQVVTPVLQALLNEHTGKVGLKFWGLEPPPDLAGHPQVRWTPMEPGDYAAFARYFNPPDFDIAIAPLASNRFNAAKSAIKFLEYTALGLPGVYSRVGPYAAAVAHGRTGWLAGTLDDWRSGLEHLLGSSAERQAMAAAAQADLRARWLLQDHLSLWQSAYQQVKAAYRPREATTQLASVLTAIQTAQGEQQAAEEKLQQELHLLVSELDEIKSSRGGQLLQAYWNLRGRLNKP